MAAIGYVSIHRQIWDNPIWENNEPFDKRSAWIDLILLANHENKKVIFDGNAVTVKRGQFITSEMKLANRWHWKRDKVHRYLMLLVKLGMIAKNSTSRCTTITIVNYGNFQDKRTSKNTSKGATTGASLGATTGAQTIMNNNINNVNKEKAAPVVEKTWEELNQEEWDD